MSDFNVVTERPALVTSDHAEAYITGLALTNEMDLGYISYIGGKETSRGIWAVIHKNTKKTTLRVRLPDDVMGYSITSTSRFMAARRAVSKTTLVTVVAQAKNARILIVAGPEELTDDEVAQELEAQLMQYMHNIANLPIPHDQGPTLWTILQDKGKLTELTTFGDCKAGWMIEPGIEWEIILPRHMRPEDPFKLYREARDPEPEPEPEKTHGGEVQDLTAIWADIVDGKLGYKAGKFKLGRIVSTPGAIDLLRSINQSPSTYLARHKEGDWGDMDSEDIKANENGLKHGDRIFSSYDVGNDQKIWIITEWDRSATTILLPDEY